MFPDESQLGNFMDPTGEGGSSQESPAVAQKIATPIVRPPSEDDLEPMSVSALRGLFNQTSAAGEVPSSETFNQQFRKSTSPAREILANMFYGMASGATGEKFRSLRQQKYDQFLEDRQVKLKQQAQAQQMQLAVGQIAQQMVKQRQQQQLQTDIANAKTEEGRTQFAAKYGLDVAKYQMDLDKFNQHIKEVVESQRHTASTETKVPNANYQQALNETVDSFRAKGINDPLADPKTAVAFRGIVADRKDELDKKQADLKATADKGKTTLVMVPNETGGFGVKEVGTGGQVPPGSIAPGGLNAYNIPTSTTRTMAERAPTVIGFADKMLKIINDNEKLFGPMETRWNDYKANKIGVPGGDFKRFSAMGKILSTALMNMHVGARGSEGMLAHFETLLGDSFQSGENLKVVLNVIRDYAKDKEEEGQVKFHIPKPQFDYDPTTGKTIPRKAK